MARLPRFIEERILRRRPAGVGVVPGSTPVVSFGDFRSARFATLGWNPSKNEFLDRRGLELDGDNRRLETRSTIGAAVLERGSTNAARFVFEGCSHYFNRNPFHWFNKLQKVLRHVGASYQKGSACHLDLVQWATDPVWRGLTDAQQARLLKADLPFLVKQLSRSSIRLLLLNGSGIVDAFCEHVGDVLKPVTLSRQGRIRIHAGRHTNGMKVIGWNINLQSSRGVKNAEIKWIGTIVKRLMGKV